MPQVCAQTDSSHIDKRLDGITVKANRKVMPLEDSKDGMLSLNTRKLQQMPQILGIADPIRILQLLPGIQTNSEMSSGIFMQGCDNAHNSVSLCGAPIYNVSHLLGFFSVLNGAHFKNVEVSKSSTGTSGGNKLGGSLTFNPMDSLLHKTRGQIGIGLIESHATIDVPVSKTLSIYASARLAYINLLYSNVLKIDETKINYDFCDYNLTAIWKPTQRNKIIFNLYGGNDVFKSKQNNYASIGNLTWGNLAASLIWESVINQKLKMRTTAYASKYRNKFDLTFGTMHSYLLSEASDLGLKTDFDLQRRNGTLHFGFENAYRPIKPQEPRIENSFNSINQNTERTKSNEMSAYVMREFGLNSTVRGEMAMRANFFAHSSYHHFSLDPRLALKWTIDKNNDVRFNYGLYHQYIHQALISGIGLPTDFWFASSKNQGAAKSHSFSVEYTTRNILPNFSISISPYYKILSGQNEYQGTILDIVSTQYDINKNIILGKGYNTGFELLIKKTSGQLTGWLSYSWGIAKRKFPFDKNRWFNSSHSRTHDLSIVANYQINRRLSACAVFIFASGSPYTPLKYVYLLNDNVLCEYTDHNSKRLPDYHRLDLAINYWFKRNRNNESGLNISIYNAYGHDNALYRYLSTKNNRISYNTNSLSFKFIPSISYFYKF